MCKECVEEIQKLDAVKDRELLRELAGKYEKAYFIAILLKPEDFEVKEEGEGIVTFEQFLENAKMNYVAVIEKLDLVPTPASGLMAVTKILQEAKDRIDLTLKTREFTDDLEKKIKEAFPNARIFLSPYSL